MNSPLLSFVVLIISMLQIQQSSCQQDSKINKPLLPLAVGNEWIYSDSVFTDGSFASVKNDTDRIVSRSTFEGNPTFTFSDGRELMLKGDSLFQLVRQRTGLKFPTPVFFPVETETTFNYAFGGDVMKQQTVSKMKACPENSWDASNCYLVTDGCNGERIFGKGTGVIWEKKTDCSSKDYSVRTLIKMKIIR